MELNKQGDDRSWAQETVPKLLVLKLVQAGFTESNW